LKHTAKIAVKKDFFNIIIAFFFFYSTKKSLKLNLGDPRSMIIRHRRERKRKRKREKKNYYLKNEIMGRAVLFVSRNERQRQTNHCIVNIFLKRLVSF